MNIKTHIIPARATAVALASLGLACTPVLLDDDGETETEAGEETGDETGTETDLEPNWHESIAPLVGEKCLACHRDGGIAPFSMETYEQAAPFAELMAGSVEAGEMPPWPAQDSPECEIPHPWKDDRRLSDTQRDMLRDWADLGAPEGDPADAAPIPELPAVDLVDPDVEALMDEWYLLEEGPDQFRCVVLDPEITEDVWMTGIQVLPGNTEVVHHVIAWTDPGDLAKLSVGPDGTYECFSTPGILPLLGGSKIVGAWVPGIRPIETPQDTGFHLTPGTKIVLNIHYHPTGGGPQLDKSGVAITHTSDPPSRLAEVALIGNFTEPMGDGMGLLPGPSDPPSGPEFRIPAGVADHRETMIGTMPVAAEEARVWLAGTHMHYVGSDARVSIERVEPEGSPPQECLVQTPAWDFQWQGAYIYDAPFDALPIVRPGDRIEVRCDYDNTLQNAAVAGALAEQGLSEPHDVLLGDDTLDEMCLGFLGIAYDAP